MGLTVLPCQSGAVRRHASAGEQGDGGDGEADEYAIKRDEADEPGRVLGPLARVLYEEGKQSVDDQGNGLWHRGVSQNGFGASTRGAGRMPAYHTLENQHRGVCTKLLGIDVGYEVSIQSTSGQRPDELEDPGQDEPRGKLPGHREGLLRTRRVRSRREGAEEEEAWQAVDRTRNVC